jgi:hypothetical protein
VTNKEIEELAGHRPVSAWVVKLVGDAIAIEREACAKVCEEQANELWLKNCDSEGHGANQCSVAIRARGLE